ncbi:MAG: diaminopimelate epimerase [Roseimicrobium sp.]
MATTLKFWKMNGAGNDFVLLDNRELTIQLTKDQIAKLCDRHRGIGADGLLAVEPATEGADWKMRYYNADGGEAEMCGNGARCFARYVNKLHDNTLNSLKFETLAGVISADFHDDQVCITMSQPHGAKLNQWLNVDGTGLQVHSINTGVPHAVVFVEELDKVDVVRFGAGLRHHEAFAPKGTNANFVKVQEPGTIAIRTYERGVEAETLACGTGMVASALIYHELHQVSAPIAVVVKGGDTLKVGFEKEADGFKNVTLHGPADFVFEGVVELA